MTLFLALANWQVTVGGTCGKLLKQKICFTEKLSLYQHPQKVCATFNH